MSQKIHRQNLQKVRRQIEDQLESAGANLSTSRNATTVTIQSDSGDNASIPSADATTAGILTAADWQKIQDASVADPIGAAWHDTSALGSTEDVRVYLPEAITITEVNIQTKGGTGSCVLDILEDDLEGNVTSIVASAAPEISSGTSYNDATLTGWTTSISGNKELIFRIDSTSTFTFIEVLLTI